MSVRVKTRSRPVGLRRGGPVDREDRETAADTREDFEREGVASPVVAASGEEDLLAADLWLETPPRPERTILARFEYLGRDCPIPLTDPAEAPERAA